MNRSFLTSLYVLLSLCLFFVCTNSVLAAWTAPTQPPPSGNVPGPVLLNPLSTQNGFLDITSPSDPAVLITGQGDTGIDVVGDLYGILATGGPNPGSAGVLAISGDEQGYGLFAQGDVGYAAGFQGSVLFFPQTEIQVPVSQGTVFFDKFRNSLFLCTNPDEEGGCTDLDQFTDIINNYISPWGYGDNKVFLAEASYAIHGYEDFPLYINGDDDVQIRIDSDNDTVNTFSINNGDNTSVFTVNENGQLSLKGQLILGQGGSQPTAGALRWSGSDFEGYDGSTWLSLTTPPQENSSSQENNSSENATDSNDSSNSTGENQTGSESGNSNSESGNTGSDSSDSSESEGLVFWAGGGIEALRPKNLATDNVLIGRQEGMTFSDVQHPLTVDSTLLVGSTVSSQDSGILIESLPAVYNRIQVYENDQPENLELNPLGGVVLIGGDSDGSAGFASGQGDLYVDNNLEVDGEFCLGDQCYDEWPTGGYCNGPQFQGFSSDPDDGNAGGYVSVSDKCPEGEHICSQEDIFRSIQCGDQTSAIFSSNGSGWINSGPSSNGANDCKGWTDGSNASVGSVWYVLSGDTSGGTGYAARCDQSYSFSCCK